MRLTIVEDRGLYWIADEEDYVDGPYMTLSAAEWQLELMTEPEDDDGQD